MFWQDSRKYPKVSSKKEKEVWQDLWSDEEFYFIITVTGLSRPNTEKDNGNE